MSGEIDQISQALGRLTADMEASQRQRAELFKMVENVNRTMAALNQTLVVVQERQDAARAEIVLLKTDVGNLKVTKAKAAAAMSIIAALGAGAYEGVSRVAVMFSRIVGGQ